MKHLIKKSSYYLIILLGLTSPAGSLLNNPVIEWSGRLTAASPLAKVFGSYEGLEYWAQDYHLAFHFTDTTTQKMSIGPVQFNKLKGNHTMHISLIYPFAFAPLMDYGNWSRLVRYALCDHGPMARDFEINKDIDWIDVTVTRKPDHPDKVWQGKLYCKT